MKSFILDILIVDNEPTNIQTVASLLDENYNISVATSGKSALELLEKRKTPPHIIILDIHMPEMDGFELTKTIFKNTENKDIQIIFLSANDSIDYLEKGFNLGACDYITKPLEPKLFLLKLNFWSKFVKTSLQNKENYQLVEEYKSVVDRSTIVSKTNKSGIITYVNDKFCELSEYSQDELIGRSHNMIRHPEMPQEIFTDLWKTISSGKPWKGIVKNKTKSGGFYVVDTIISPILDAAGNIVEYIGIRHDITAIETAKNELKKQHSITSNKYDEILFLSNLYEEAIEESNIIIRVDLERNISYCNEAFYEISGYTKEELIGKPYSILRHPDTSTKDVNNMWNTIQNGKIWKGTLMNLAKDGSTYHSLSTVVPLKNKEGKIIGFMGIRKDITELINLHTEIEETQRELIYKLGEIGETRSKETGHHVKRVAEYSKFLALKAGVSKEEAELLKYASPMHDIGKIGIPDSILNKPGKLTVEEFEIMKKHASIGYEMLKGSSRSILQASAIVAHEHHEKWDGTGYPNSLQGEDIHIFGRITAIADVFDALSSDRVYKKAWPLDKILAMLEEEKGKHFDPHLIELFFENLDKFLEIKHKIDAE